MTCRFLDDSKGEEDAQKLRSGAFKIIPRIAEGSWVIKQSVGQNTPVLLGRKLTTKYFRWAAARLRAGKFPDLLHAKFFAKMKRLSCLSARLQAHEQIVQANTVRLKELESCLTAWMLEVRRVERDRSRFARSVQLLCTGQRG